MQSQVFDSVMVPLTQNPHPLLLEMHVCFSVDTRKVDSHVDD